MGRSRVTRGAGGWRDRRRRFLPAALAAPVQVAADDVAVLVDLGESEPNDRRPLAALLTRLRHLALTARGSAPATRRTRSAV